MEFIIHRIRLKQGIEPARFESWVQEVDYASCPQLPSVVSFSVQRVSADPAAEVHYFEIIGVTGSKAFADDMASDVFHRLETGFDAMAEVVDELAGERVGLGYRAD